jgi:HlyD family secretion protein
MMTRSRATGRGLVLVAAGAVAVGAAVAWWLAGRDSSVAASAQSVESARQSAAAQARDVPTAVRLNGLVEAVDFYSVVVPRVTGTGQGSPQLTIVRLAPKGALVKKGDLLVEFDRQLQMRNALDKRAEWLDLEEQIKKKRADQNSLRAQDETALKAAENAVALAKLEVLKNSLLPRIEAEKNTLSLEAAEAKFKQLGEAFVLKQKAAVADLQILEVRRDRAAKAMGHAEGNAEKMVIRAPIDGLVVLKSIWKGGTMGEPQEGEELWPGAQVLDLVGPSSMRVRVRVNQADLAGLQAGLAARVTLDAYPGKEYPAKLLQISPIAVPGSFSPKVRTFVALFGIEGSDPQLAPDLSAAVDVQLAATRGGVRERSAGL